MAPFLKKQTQALAEIKLPSSKSGDTFNSSPHHFLSHETIVGDAVFTLAPGTSFDHSKIQLKGKFLQYVTLLLCLLISSRVG